jgi:hypothetical protein
MTQGFTNTQNLLDEDYAILEGQLDGRTLKGGVQDTEQLSLFNNSVNNEGLTIESDGTISTNTPSYETLVISDNDIPNKKWVEDNTGSSSASDIFMLMGG